MNKIKKTLAYLTLGASSLLAGGNLDYAQALPIEKPRNEQETQKVEKELNEKYKPSYVYSERASDESSKNPDIFLSATVFGWLLFTEKYIRRRK